MVYVNITEWEDLKILDSTVGVMYEILILYFGSYGVKMIANNFYNSIYFIYSWNIYDEKRLEAVKLN